MSVYGGRVAQRQQHQKSFTTRKLRRLQGDRKVFTLSYKWIFLTAGAITSAIFICYTALHYLIAFAPPQSNIWAAGSNSAANMAEDKSRIGFASRFINSFGGNRAFFRAGHGLDVHYTLPENTTLSLQITRCQSMPLAEVYQCRPINTQNITLDAKRLGTERILFKDAAFYQYTATLLGPKGQNLGRPRGYNVVWRRS